MTKVHFSVNIRNLVTIFCITQICGCTELPRLEAISVANVRKIERVGSIRNYSSLDTTLRNLLSAEGERAGINTISFSPDGKLLAWGDKLGYIYIWRVRPLRREMTIDAASWFAKKFNVRRSNFLPYGINYLAISHDNKLLAFSGHGLALWNLLSRKVSGYIPPFNTYCGIFSATFLPGTNQIIIGGDFSRLEVWTVNGQQVSILREEHSGGRRLDKRLALSLNGNILAIPVTGKWGMVQLWDTDLWVEKVKTLSGQGVRVCALSSDGRILAIGHDSSSEITLWDTVLNRKITTLRGHSGPISFLKFVSNDRLLVSASPDENYQEQLKTIKAQFNGTLQSIKRMGTGRPVGVIKFWDIVEKKEIHSFPVKSFGCIDMSSDGHLIATSGEEMEVIFLYGVPKQR